MVCRKRGIPVASATLRFVRCHMRARLRDYCNGSVVLSRFLPAKRRENMNQIKIASPPDLVRGLIQKVFHAGSAGGRWAEQGLWPDMLQEHAISERLPGPILPYPLLAVQGATVFRAGLLRRGASFTVACLPFSPPSLPTYCHPRFYASPGPRWRRSERRRSESDI